MKRSRMEKILISMRRIKIIIEEHPDAYVAYSTGLKGVAVAEGATYEAALADENRPFGFTSKALKKKRTISGAEIFNVQRIYSDH